MFVQIVKWKLDTHQLLFREESNMVFDGEWIKAAYKTPHLAWISESPAKLSSVFLAGAEGDHTSGPDQKHITDAQSSASCDPDCLICWSLPFLRHTHVRAHTHG